mmetsp:Transcript_9691/g.23868  ORF Transcript_9691/g.23868 Transcript_9691/m.23868 type:complete len:236 (+) Transcript_9691:1754-2461(+)
MAGTLLANVEASKGEAEAVDAPQEILEPPLSEDAISALVKRIVDDKHVACKLLRSRVRKKPGHGGRGLASGDVACVGDCLCEAVADVQQQLAVGLARVLVGILPVHGRHRHHLLDHRSTRSLSRHIRLACDVVELLLERLGASRSNGEVPQQLVNLTPVELCCPPLAQVYHSPRQLRRHKGVAVTVAAHPRPQSQEATVDGQGGLANLLEGIVHRMVVLRKSLPDALLNNRQPVP